MKGTTIALALASLTAAIAVAPASADTTTAGQRAATTGRAAQQLASQLAVSRVATAKYATDLDRAKKDGYTIITRMIPDMGWHFLNPKVKGFDVRKPAILVYGKRGPSWQLVAYEWVFPAKPAKPPLPGATYGSFGAACHFQDGTFVFQASQDACPAKSPQTGKAFGFWHPDLVTLHVWAWYPNPAGLFSGMNPLMHPFNAG